MKTVVVVALLTLAVATKAFAQQTIPDLVRTLPPGESLDTTISGCPPLMDVWDYVRFADVVVSGVMGDGQAELTDDMRSIKTTYDFKVRRVVVNKGALSGSTPSIRVWHIGGQVVIEGHQASVSGVMLPVSSGSPHLLFLVKDPVEVGVFQIVAAADLSGGRVRSLQKPYSSLGERYDRLNANDLIDVIARGFR